MSLRTIFVGGHDWVAPDLLPPFQILPQTIKTNLSARTGIPEFVKQLNRMAFDKRPVSYFQLFESMDVKEALAVGCTTQSVFVMKSSIKHPKYGDGLLAGQRFEQGETVAAYYGTLVYHNLNATSW